MGSKRLHRLRRLWASGSPVLLGGGTALTLALATLVLANVTGPTTGGASAVSGAGSLNAYFGWALVVVTAIGLIALGLQWHAEYRRRTYDPTWALQFDLRFNSPEMCETRCAAARGLKENQGRLRGHVELNDLEDVLDFFEDLGFYMQGDHLTPEVVHHSFLYWLRGYYTAARDYIEAAQEHDPAAWECVPQLFEAVYEIEKEHAGAQAQKFCDSDDLNKFLEDEIGLCAASIP